MTNQATKNQVEFFLHNKKTNFTVCFSELPDGSIKMEWLQTRNPNEDVNDEIYTKEQARLEWKKVVKEGGRSASGWSAHQTKRGSSWDSDYYHD
jgi:hypothetical protein